MLKKIGISAFLLGVTITQALAESGHGTSDLHETTEHAVTDAHGEVMEHAAEAAGHVAEHGAEHAAAGLPQLDPSSYPSQLFWLVIVFIFMYIFFSKKTVPQYARTIEDRADRISEDLDTAERLKEEVADLQHSYEEKLAQAREESFNAFVESEKESKKEAERKTADFQERSRKKIEELEANIEEALEGAMKDMSDIAADIASQASEKIIGVKVDIKTAKDAVKSVNKAA